MPLYVNRVYVAERPPPPSNVVARKGGGLPRFRPSPLVNESRARLSANYSGGINTGTTAQAQPRYHILFFM